MALFAAGHTDTPVATIKNTFYEFVSPSEDSEDGAVLRRTSSSPSCSAFFARAAVPGTTAEEGHRSRQWADMEDGDSEEEGGSSLDLGPPPRQEGFSDLLQVQTVPCAASCQDPCAKEAPAGPRRGGLFGSRHAAASPTAAASKGQQAAVATLGARTRLRASAVAYVPPAGAWVPEAAPWPRPSPAVLQAPAPAAAGCSSSAAEQAATSATEQAAGHKEWPQGTTVMLKNLPSPYTRDMLIELLQSKGFLDHCNFLYLPMNFQSSQNVGYAFLNLSNDEQAKRFFSVFDGFKEWAVDTDQACSVCPSNTNGLSANLERYRNSPIMREDVPEEFKPILLSGGKQVAFPSPTKKHLRRLRCRKGYCIKVESTVDDDSSWH